MKQNNAKRSQRSRAICHALEVWQVAERRILIVLLEQLDMSLFFPSLSESICCSMSPTTMSTSSTASKSVLRCSDLSVAGPVEGGLDVAGNEHKDHCHPENDTTGRHLKESESFTSVVRHFAFSQRCRFSGLGPLTFTCRKSLLQSEAYSLSSPAGVVQSSHFRLYITLHYTTLVYI